MDFLWELDILCDCSVYEVMYLSIDCIYSCEEFVDIDIFFIIRSMWCFIVLDGKKNYFFIKIG